MPRDDREITALPVVVPLAVVAFAVLLWWLHRRGALTAPRAVVAALVCGYGAGVLANTVFPIELGGSGQDLPWTVFLDLVPLADAEPRDMLQNVQLVSLGRTLMVVPESGRSQLREGVVAVPVVDAPQVTTVIAWPPHSRSLAVAGLVQAATRL